MSATLKVLVCVLEKNYIYSISLLYFHLIILETSKRRAMFCNILSQIFIVKFTYNMLITINYLQSGAYRSCYNTILNLRSTQLTLNTTLTGDYYATINSNM